MLYYINEDIEKSMEKNAGSKARNDVEWIFKRYNMQMIQVCRVNGRKGIRLHVRNAVSLSHTLKQEKIYNSLLFFQFPIKTHSIFNSLVLKKMKQQKNKIIGIIHDLEFLRFKKEKKFSSYQRIKFEEISFLRVCDKIIVHNAKMKELLQNYGIKSDKMVELGIFDYIVDEDIKQQENKEDGIAIAGNLTREKSGYIYKLPDKPSFILYGANFQNENIKYNLKYRGSFYPNMIVSVLSGKYGLVWDGNSIDTCDGNYGNYLKYNNPHKTSLYIAGGLPVIIWKQAALASFVIKNEIGIVIDTIDEINDKINAISDEKYSKIKQNVIVLSQKVRNGYFMRTAIDKVISELDYGTGRGNNK